MLFLVKFVFTYFMRWICFCKQIIPLFIIAKSIAYPIVPRFLTTSPSSLSPSIHRRSELRMTTYSTQLHTSADDNTALPEHFVVFPDGRKELVGPLADTEALIFDCDGTLVKPGPPNFSTIANYSLVLFLCRWTQCRCGLKIGRSHVLTSTSL